MEYMADYSIFLAKLVTILVILLIIAGVILIIIRNRQEMDGHLEIKNLNQKFESMRLLLKSQIESKKQFRKSIKAARKKSKKKSGNDTRKKTFVLRFNGDIRATEVNSLREEITAILSIASQNDEVVLLLESTGGTIHGYGLAASQLKRIREKNIKLTVAVDKVAASGGYMMACVGNRIIAAPFAIIGSIGVLAQIPNFNRLLKKHNIDFEEISAGEYKRTLTLFGENTPKDREKFRQEIEEAHKLFKEFISENRHQIDIEHVSTGEYWFGKRALELKLVDDLLTSDDYLVSSAMNSDIYEIRYIRKKPISEKIVSFGTRIAEYFS